MVATDGNRIEFRHLGGGVTDNIRDYAHGRLRGIDIGIPHHKFFKNVVLQGSSKLLRGNALLFCRDYVAGHNRQHRAIHGHGHRHLIQRDAIEENLHVFNRVNRHTSLTHITLYPGMVRVIAAMGRQIEGDRQTLLTSS